MGCVKAANKFISVDQRERRKIGIVFKECEFHSRETIKRCRLAIHNAPSFCSSEVSADAF